MADMETTAASTHEDVLFDVDPLDVDEVIAARIRAGDIIVPPFPAVITALDEAAQNGASMAELARLVGTDPAIGADVLRVVNAPAFMGAGGPTFSLHNA